MATASPAASVPLTHEDDPIIGISEVARQLGKAHRTISNWCTDGLMAAIRMPSGTWGVRQSVVNKLLAGSDIVNRIKSAPDTSKEDDQLLTLAQAASVLKRTLEAVNGWIEAGIMGSIFYKEPNDGPTHRVVSRREVKRIAGLIENRML